MPDLFADSGYWLALINPRDSLHARATELGLSLTNTTVVTSEMVLTEVLNHMSSAGEYARQLASRAILAWKASSSIEVVPQTSTQFDTALERYRSRLDQAWSLVDCASFIIMETRQIQEALAFDRHFEQAGFTALLRGRE